MDDESNVDGTSLASLRISPIELYRETIGLVLLHYVLTLVEWLPTVTTEC